MPDESLIHARGLVKRFGELTAVDGIDVDVRPGEAFGFLGPNGAGKSSTMRMIGCVSPPPRARCGSWGLDPVRDGPAIRARLGVCPQQDSLDIDLTVTENITVYARYFGISRRVARERAAELLEFVQLTERADDKVEPLSGGMKRRTDHRSGAGQRARAGAAGRADHRAGPAGAASGLGAAVPAQAARVTLVLTTTTWTEAEQLCDRLVVMDHGKIVAEGSPRDLIERHSTREVVELRFGEQILEDLAGKLGGIGERVEVLPDRILVYADDGDTAAAEVHDRRLAPGSVLVRRSSLEDVFLHLTGRTLVD
jgi:lipooligosaccharide transport system ATP-binding protein